MANRYSIELSDGSRQIMTIAGVCLCIVSVFYTALLCIGLADTTPDKILMGVSGVGFEACKFIFVPVGLVLVARGLIIRGALFTTLGLVLIGLSVSASLGFLNSRTNAAYEKARVESPQYVHYSRQIETVDAKIQALQQAANIDAGSQWAGVRESATVKLAQIDALQREKEHYLAAQNQIDATHSTSAGALFDGLAAMFGSDPVAIKHHAFTVVAMLLELCGIAALSLAGLSHNVEIQRHQTVTPPPPHAIPESTREKALPGKPVSTGLVTHDGDTEQAHPRVTSDQGDTGTDGKHATRYKRIRKRIEAGTLKPSIRAVMKSESVGSTVAARWFDQLQADGVLRKDGRQYVRVEA